MITDSTKLTRNLNHTSLLLKTLISLTTILLLLSTLTKTSLAKSGEVSLSKTLRERMMELHGNAILLIWLLICPLLNQTLQCGMNTMVSGQAKLSLFSLLTQDGCTFQLTHFHSTGSFQDSKDNSLHPALTHSMTTMSLQ